MKRIFIDEISRINRKIWTVLSHIQKKYNVKIVLLGDFLQLLPVEKYKYNIQDSESFVELVDCQLIEILKLQSFERSGIKNLFEGYNDN